jgi:hypothetical protein
MLRQVLEHAEAEGLASLAQNTYETLCLLLAENAREPESPYYRRMVHHLFEESEEAVFFLPARSLGGATQRTHRAVEACLAYEQSYRRERRMAGTALALDEAHESFRASLAKFRELAAKGDGLAVRQLEE